MKNRLAFTFFFISLISVNHINAQKILFNEDFRSFKPQMISGDVVGAFAEYHNIQATQPKGNWIVSSFKSEGSQRAWKIIEENKHRIMFQSYTSTKEELEYTHPVIIAGDSLWQNYKVRVKFSPESKDEQSGFIFRYRNDRCYYFFGVKNNKIFIKKVNHAKSFHTSEQTILAEKEINWKPNEIFDAEIEVNNSQISAWLNSKFLFTVKDQSFLKGKIGLLADVPARYFSVLVTTGNNSYKNYIETKQKYNAQIEQLRNVYPKPVLWKKIMTGDFGAPRSLRFGDLDGDGKIDILIGQVKNHGPKDRNSELACLTAVNLDGKILWQTGKPDIWNDKVTSDVAFQIYDINNDGRNEVIYCKDMQIIIADGATGKIKSKVSTPKNDAKPPHDLFPNILGDCIYICNVRGLARPQDFILKDRYEHFYIYNDKLDLLWKGACKTGHYPYALDIDKDGKDEIAVGYSLYDDNGKQIFCLDNQLQDHADGVSILKFKDSSDYIIMNAASDEGLVYYDLNGKILKHFYIGHVQNPAVANLRDDLPGLEAVTVNFWGSQGIIHMMNSDMEIYHDFEPFQQGSPMRPVNWTGKSEELIMLSADPNYGGMFDGYGRTVVTYPADGHPDLCYAVVDLTGDCRDEIVVWDPFEIWIYTQSDNPKSGKLYKPKRDELFNFSNYSTAVSLPGWNEGK